MGWRIMTFYLDFYDLITRTIEIWIKCAKNERTAKCHIANSSKAIVQCTDIASEDKFYFLTLSRRNDARAYSFKIMSIARSIFRLR